MQGYTVSNTNKFVSGVNVYHDIQKLANANLFQTIFDIGANVGQTTFKLVEHFPNSRIFAFEPVSETFKELEKNTRAQPNVTVAQFAFGTEQGRAIITLRPNSEWNSLVPALNLPSTAPVPHEDVKIETIDCFITANQISTIDLLKTDTEGYDLAALRGAENALSQNRIAFIYSEVGFIKADTRHTFFPELNDFLARFGFEFYDLYEIAHPPHRGIQYCNALFVNVNTLKPPQT